MLLQSSIGEFILKPNRTARNFIRELELSKMISDLDVYQTLL